MTPATCSTTRRCWSIGPDRLLAEDACADVRDAVLCRRRRPGCRRHAAGPHRREYLFRRLDAGIDPTPCRPECRNRALPLRRRPRAVTPQGWADWAGTALKSRCVENGVFGIACNYVGTVTCASVSQSFPGGGMAIDPCGKVIADWTAPTGEPGMLLVDLSADVLRQARAEPEYLYRFRRPELYESLARTSSP